jgi:hypothetical protein
MKEEPVIVRILISISSEIFSTTLYKHKRERVKENEVEREREKDKERESERRKNRETSIQISSQIYKTLKLIGMINFLLTLYFNTVNIDYEWHKVLWDQFVFYKE